MSVGTSRSGVRTWRRQRLDRPSNWKPPPDIPDSWRALIDRYERESWRRVFVIGPMDAGKSTFCHCLARTTVTPTLLDCDLGQKMIGPPGCVTLGRLDPTGALYLLRMHFVGQVHPVGNAASVVAGLARLARTTGVERLVVNSSGLITDSGIALN